MINAGSWKVITADLEDAPHTGVESTESTLFHDQCESMLTGAEQFFSEHGFAPKAYEYWRKCDNLPTATHELVWDKRRYPPMVSYLVMNRL